MHEYQLANVPSAEDYVAGLSSLSDRVSAIQRRLLQAQYSAPNRTVTASMLASLADISGGHPIVNSQYGRLGHMYCDATGLQPDLRPDDTHRWWSVWSSGYTHPDGFQWVMHPQVATALETLGWVDPDASVVDIVYASDLPAPPSRILTTTLRVVRDTTLARFLKDMHNNVCQICDSTIQLPDGKRYSEAHHIQPLGSPHDGPDIAANILVLCPNHHAMCDYGAITLSLDMLTQHDDHDISLKYVNYHNTFIVPNAAT